MRALNEPEAEKRVNRLSELPPESQQLLVSRAAGLTPTEIQKQTGLTSRQYRKRIQRANRRLTALRQAERT